MKRTNSFEYYMEIWNKVQDEIQTMSALMILSKKTDTVMKKWSTALMVITNDRTHWIQSTKQRPHCQKWQGLNMYFYKTLEYINIKPWTAMGKGQTWKIFPLFLQGDPVFLTSFLFSCKSNPSRKRFYSREKNFLLQISTAKVGKIFWTRRVCEIRTCPRFWWRSKSQNLFFLYEWEALVTRSLHVKYEGSIWNS